jgi:hypothetical protein
MYESHEVLDEAVLDLVVGGAGLPNLLALAQGVKSALAPLSEVVTGRANLPFSERMAQVMREDLENSSGTAPQAQDVDPFHDPGPLNTDSVSQMMDHEMQMDKLDFSSPGNSDVFDNGEIPDIGGDANAELMSFDE